MALIVAWVVFRSDSLPNAWTYIQQMFLLSNVDGLFSVNITMKGMIYFVMLLGIFISLNPLKIFSGGTPFNKEYSNLNFVLQFGLAIVSVLVLYLGARNPFIYFNF